MSAPEIARPQIPPVNPIPPSLRSRHWEVVVRDDFTRRVAERVDVDGTLADAERVAREMEERLDYVRAEVREGQ